MYRLSQVLVSVVHSYYDLFTCFWFLLSSYIICDYLQLYILSTYFILTSPTGDLHFMLQAQVPQLMHHTNRSQDTQLLLVSSSLLWGSPKAARYPGSYLCGVWAEVPVPATWNAGPPWGTSVRNMYWVWKVVDNHTWYRSSIETRNKWISLNRSGPHLLELVTTCTLYLFNHFTFVLIVFVIITVLYCDH